MSDDRLSEFLFRGDGQDPMSLNSSCYDVLKKHIIDSREFCQVREDSAWGPTPSRSLGQHILAAVAG
eukprot:8549158-Ditylum_brightwellii.AAC.1